MLNARDLVQCVYASVITTVPCLGLFYSPHSSQAHTGTFTKTSCQPWLLGTFGAYTTSGWPLSLRELQAKLRFLFPCIDVCRQCMHAKVPLQDKSPIKIFKPDLHFPSPRCDASRTTLCNQFDQGFGACSWPHERQSLGQQGAKTR